MLCLGIKSPSIAIPIVERPRERLIGQLKWQGAQSRILLGCTRCNVIYRTPIVLHLNPGIAIYVTNDGKSWDWFLRCINVRKSWNQPVTTI
ncbi:hypothetical protein D3C76_1630120 [compost metagenome]